MYLITYFSYFFLVVWLLFACVFLSFFCLFCVSYELELVPSNCFENALVLCFVLRMLCEDSI